MSQPNNFYFDKVLASGVFVKKSHLISAHHPVAWCMYWISQWFSFWKKTTIKVKFIFTSPQDGVARYCFNPVGLCVWPIFWYFISRLLEQISIWNLYVYLYMYMKQILTYFLWRHFSARSSFHCFIENPKRCIWKKIEIFLGLGFCDMTVPSKSNIPSLWPWPMKVNFFQSIEYSPISILYKFQIDISSILARHTGLTIPRNPLPRRGKYKLHFGRTHTQTETGWKQYLATPSRGRGKNMAVIQPRPTHIPNQCAKFGDDQTSFLVCLTCRKPIPIFWASKVCPMLKNSDIYDELLQTFAYILPVGQIKM